MSKKVSNKEEIKKQQKLHEEELKQIALEQKQRRNKTIIASSVVIVVVGIALYFLISYMNYELPSAADLYVSKTIMVDNLVTNLNKSMDDESAVQVTVFLETRKNTDGQAYRMSTIKEDGTVKYYENVTDLLDNALANQIESMFNSRINQIQAILDTKGGFVCVFTEESYDYLGSINRLAYASNGEEFTAYMSEQNYMLLKQYSANWFYYVGY